MNEARFREAEARLWQSERLDPKEYFIDLPRIGTRVRVQEVGEGSPVLFIHGGPNSGSTWAQLAARMPGFRCLMLDRPGTGLSDDFVATRELIDSYRTNLVADVLDALVVERSHVVASSFGGYCALWSAEAHPQRFDRMVQMACPAMLPGQQVPQFMKALMLPGMRKLIAALPPTKKSQESILRQIGHGKSIDAGILSEAHGDWYTALTKHTNTMRNEFEMIYGARAKDGFNQEYALGADVLARIEIPTHFLWGEDDAFGGEEVADWVVDSMPNATLEMIPDAGHLPWIDDPKHIAEQTTRFLEAGPVGSSKTDGRGEKAHD